MAPEVPAPDASGFCAFLLNPASTKWHCVTLSIVPGAWQKKGLRPPGQDFGGRRPHSWEMPTGATWNPTNRWKIKHRLLLVGLGIILAVVVVLGKKIHKNTTMRKPKKRYFLTAFKPFDLPSFLEAYLNSENPEFLPLTTILSHSGSFHCKASAKDLTVNEPVIRLAQASLFAFSWPEFCWWCLFRYFSFGQRKGCNQKRKTLVLDRLIEKAIFAGFNMIY